MPSFYHNTEVDIDVEEFFDECSDEEKKDLLDLCTEACGCESLESEVALQYFRNEFDLKKLFKAIGADQVERVLSEIKGN